MAVTVPLVVAGLGAGAAVAGTAQAIDSARVGRHTASDAAKRERDALAALQAEPTPTMPTPDDETVRNARRRSIAGQLARRGRASTILTDAGNTDALGA